MGMSQKVASNAILNEYAYTDTLKTICSQLQNDLGIEQTVALTHNALPDTTLQYAQCSKHFGKICDIDYKNGILISIATDNKIILWKKSLQKKGLFKNKDDTKYTFE